MVQDEGLLWAYSDTDEVWAPIHAWRALGQLKAEEAVPGLLAVFPVIDEQEFNYMMDEMPNVMGMIGPGVLPALAAYLADPRRGTWSRATAANSIVKIVKQHPATRPRAIEILVGQLSRYDTQDPTFNALLISALMGLKAIEARDLMAAAFAAEQVDLRMVGDWEEVQIELGLLEERLTPRPAKGWNPKWHDLAQAMKKGDSAAGSAGAGARAGPTAGRRSPAPARVGQGRA